MIPSQTGAQLPNPPKMPRDKRRSRQDGNRELEQEERDSTSGDHRLDNVTQRKAAPKRLVVKNVSEYLELVASRMLWLDIRPNNNMESSLLELVRKLPKVFRVQLKALEYPTRVDGIARMFLDAADGLFQPRFEAINIFWCLSTTLLDGLRRMRQRI